VAHSEKATDVFPILVLQDPIFACGPVARVLSDRFQLLPFRQSAGSVNDRFRTKTEGTLEFKNGEFGGDNAKSACGVRPFRPV
jgi:hypothetical protein